MDIHCIVKISGKVQGVYFRESTRQVAEALGLTGFVRNLSDGRVEAHFCGSREMIEEILRWCKRGPSAALVDDIRFQWQNEGDKFVGFNVRRD
jgi:acylphosphatase